ncbi:alpha/beta hydrolase [Salinibacterium sp. SWN139]|uniref:alpha/beta hydrolase n=1 Tax=Salinibacterium sp. SWN139 TaxID=2792055 RepID=UPI0018CE5363|nr:alpha/beta hydrolase [Salinibacterium sp. SWN139]MBH0054869.1 alpha/beta hydrolase [Salinibacterium sp. SWN139]
MEQVREVILVHGLWHQPAHLSLVTRELRENGIRVIAPQLHRGSLAADTAVVQDAVDACASPPVVMGHSYGGSVITGLRDAHHLVFVAAFVPDSGESSASLGGPEPLIKPALITTSDGSTRVDPSKAGEYLYGDCSDEVSEWATTLLRRQAPGHGRGVPSHIGWHSTRSTYVICARDRALDPELQREMARRCDDAVEIATSHSPFISEPKTVASLLARAVSN